MKTLGILQPGYLPWLGFFDQVDQSDIFVLYDDVQYDKNGWRNRNKIKTAQGEHWLTVPIILQKTPRQLIKDVVINNTVKWQKKHISTLLQNYTRSKYKHIVEEICMLIASKNWIFLIDLNFCILSTLLKILGIEKPIYFSSNLVSGIGKNERIIAIVKNFNGDIFIEGSSGKNYIDVEKFKQNNIQISYQEYKHPVYNQLHGTFIPYLSILDLLCNCGPDSLAIIRSGRCQINAY